MDPRIPLEAPQIPMDAEQFKIAQIQVSPHPDDKQNILDALPAQKRLLFSRIVTNQATIPLAAEQLPT